MSNIFLKLYHRIRAEAHLAEPTKMALIVRGDLGMTKGKTSAQCAHAAVMCFQDASKRQPSILNAWLSLGQPKIVLRVESLKEIENIAKLANERNVTHAVIRDAGKTQVTAGTATVLGLGPDTFTNIDGLVKHLKLL